MTVKLSPLFNDQQETSAGVPAVGTLLYTYAAGSSTLQSTFTSSTGLVAQTNPVVFDSLGFPTGGEIWLTSGLTYKFVWKTAAGVTLKTVDNVSGINDTTVATDEWSDSGLTPTYVSTTSYTVAGDQTTALHIGRRQKFTVTAGTVYGRITNSVYNGTTLTTLTIQMDGSQTLDSGLSAVANSNLRANILSLPVRAGTAAGTDTYTVTLGLTRYVKDDEYQVNFTNANLLTTSTLNSDSLGAKTIVLPDSAAVFAGAIKGQHKLRYDGTNMVLLNPRYTDTGTFTPAITLGGGATGVTYSVQSGRYQRVGNRVSFQLRVLLTAKGSSTGSLLITGLPFTSAALPQAVAFRVDASTATTGALVSASSTVIQLFRTSGTSSLQLADTDLTNTSDFSIGGTYEVA